MNLYYNVLGMDPLNEVMDLGIRVRQNVYHICSALPLRHCAFVFPHMSLQRRKTTSDTTNKVSVKEKKCSWIRL